MWYKGMGRQYLIISMKRVLAGLLEHSDENSGYIVVFNILNKLKRIEVALFHLWH
jgi:hypothetical protein